MSAFNNEYLYILFYDKNSFIWYRNRGKSSEISFVQSYCHNPCVWQTDAEMDGRTDSQPSHGETTLHHCMQCIGGW